MRNHFFFTFLTLPLLAPAVVGTKSRTDLAASGAAWTAVGQMGGASAVAIGPHAVLTAGHVSPGDFLLGGRSYRMTATSVAPIVDKSATDLRVVFVSETLPSWYAVGASVKSGASVTMVGFGDSGVVNAPGTGYAVSGATEGTRRVGTNVLSSKEATKGQGPTMRVLLKSAGDGVLGVGDSGGGWFAGGKLVGISDFTFKTNAALPDYGFDRKGYFGSGAIDLTNPTLQKWLKSGMGASRALPTGGNVNPVPEPGTWAALALGAAAVLRHREKRNR